MRTHVITALKILTIFLVIVGTFALVHPNPHRSPIVTSLNNDGSK